MQNITSKLNCKVELWGLVPFENELGEWDTEKRIIKPIVYCNISPSSASQSNNSGVTEIITHNYKITCRVKSILIPKVDMFFKFKGLKYEFKYWNPDFKNNEFLEIFCELVIE
ncbi:phage head completion protein [Clostridium sp.]|jgi:hypothetical protein|uniref:phage head completion protein n=1 Tax=Clostridium sp. TaxID=1506 RepID=UPI003EEC4FAE